MLKFYNTLTRKKETFNPIKKGEVKMYNCGPTVYNFAHIGNFRAYICSDILRRWLEYKNFKVFQVMNITDVDDKTIRDSNKKNISLSKFTKRYEKAFLEDISKLKILTAHEYPRATQHIKEMISMIQDLIDKGFAYKSDDGIYFDIKKNKKYGQLSKIKIQDQISNKRNSNDEYDKENIQDFALWKFWDKEDGDVFWDASFGKGRPGWHIECSAMSTKYLGESFDIHTGGIDLIFPHHENEIAQSECSSNKKFVNYWLHNEYILVDGKKMSKSLGNFYTLRDLLDKDYSPKSIRYLLQSSHYRQQLNFTLKGLDAAKNSVERLQDFVDKLNIINGNKDNKEINRIVEKAKSLFEKAMDDDLNISEALGIIFTTMREINKHIASNNISKNNCNNIIKFLEKLNSILDVIDFNKKPIPTNIVKLLEERDIARKNKDWNKADSIRNEINQKGYDISDTEYGSIVKIKNKNNK